MLNANAGELWAVSWRAAELKALLPFEEQSRFQAESRLFQKQREEAVIIFGSLRSLPLLYTSVTFFHGAGLDRPDVSLWPSPVKCVGVSFSMEIDASSSEAR